jgi:hypothetical protein
MYTKLADRSLICSDSTESEQEQLWNDIAVLVFTERVVAISDELGRLRIAPAGCQEESGP